MILTINNTCTEFTATTETDYLDNLLSGDPSACCTYLELSVNCCTPNTLCLRSLYNLDGSVTECGTETVNSVLYNFIDFTYTGIDVDCVQEVEITDVLTGGTTIYTSPDDLTFRIYFTKPDPIEMVCKIKTCDSLCLTYEVANSITFSNPLDICGSINDTGSSVTYPALPSEITIVGDVITLTPAAFGLTGNTFTDGVYNVVLSQNNIPESESTFVDCSVECAVVDFIADNLCSNLFSLYKALKYADECDTITYEQKCGLWEYIGRKLDYFETSPCGVTNDCGCS
jgi:hypothetical protein